VLFGLNRGKLLLVAESMDVQKYHASHRTPGTPGPAAKNVRKVRPAPSDDVLRMLGSLVERSRRSTGVPLAESFIRRENASDPPPPLAQLLRGGQGGEVRLKLYLTMSLLAVSPPYDIRPVPARSWAAALGLDDPGRNGARRVSDAIDWLAEHKFLVAERRQGTPGPVRLLSQDGSGSLYKRPTPGRRYVRLPLGLWEQGWIVRLSGTALALLIVLLDLQGGRAQPQWISPEPARHRYDLSPDTWTKGLRELRALDLVSVSRRSQGDIFDYQRMRNTYWVQEDKLQGSGTPSRRPGRTRTRR
jgi:hypothetical protein